MKEVYQVAAKAALECFAEQWREQYLQISKSWSMRWPNLITLLEYPPEIRKMIYTTSAIRKATKQRKLFPTDESALKMVW